MKQLLNIALLITLFSCKAQTIIVPIGSGDNIKDNNVQYTRYSLNSIKHQFNVGFDSKFNSIYSNVNLK